MKLKTKETRAIDLQLGDYVVLTTKECETIVKGCKVIGRVEIKRTWFHNHKKVIIKRLAKFEYEKKLWVGKIYPDRDELFNKLL